MLRSSLVPELIRDIGLADRAERILDDPGVNAVPVEEMAARESFNLFLAFEFRDADRALLLLPCFTVLILMEHDLLDTRKSLSAHPVVRVVELLDQLVQDAYVEH